MRHRHRRKPPATATPSAYRHRASRRLYPPPANNPVLAGCASTELIVFTRGAVPAPAPPSTRAPEAIAAWDDDGNGRVSLRGGSSARDRARDARPSRVPVHARRGRRRRGVRVRQPARVTGEDRRRRRARPGPGAGRTATAPRCGATIPTASRAAIARISGAWTATTTAGPANGEGGGRPPGCWRTPPFPRRSPRSARSRPRAPGPAREELQDHLLRPENRTSMRLGSNRHTLGRPRQPRLEGPDRHVDTDPGEPRLAELRHPVRAGRPARVSPVRTAPVRTAQLMRTFGAEQVRDVCQRDQDEPSPSSREKHRREPVPVLPCGRWSVG